jgi:D-beta-D-heptose 7-phosphate kinase/D-beta-D-heptose 1-phosphate adenosyltransferase
MTILLTGAKKLPTKSELLYDPKIRSPHSLGNALSAIRQTNHRLKVGFTNGKFRTLTPSHCVFLSLAKTKCDILIVGVNSDYSLRLNKAESKFSGQERAFALASLSFVDYVCLFDEENPYLAITDIQPDLVFKGPDYKDKQVVSAGKPVEIIEHPFDIHVSDLENKQSASNKFFKL